MMSRGLKGQPGALQTASGFTLVELVVVIAIIAVLVALSVPSYQSFVMKSRRTEAKDLLYTAAQRQQQFFTANSELVGYTDDAGLLSVPTTSTNGYYSLGIVVSSVGGVIKDRYTLTATPVGAQTADSACGTYTLNSLGTRTVSGSQTTPPCW